MTIKDFTNQDWDRLFPIKLMKYNSEWKTIFETERITLLLSIKSEFILIATLNINSLMARDRAHA